jgi:hypothetical protein
MIQTRVKMMSGATRIQAILLVAIMTVSAFAFIAGGESESTPPTRAGMYQYSENYNISFNKPTFYGTDDPYYSEDVAENTWDDIAMVVYFQDQHTTSKTVGSYTLNIADIYQGAFVPVDGSTVSTGTQQRVIMEDFTATWCTYCTGVVGAMERIDHDTTANLFPDEYIGIEFHASSSSDVYYKADSNTRGSFYTVPGYPTWVIDGIDPTVGGSTDANDSALETQIRNRVATAGANAAPFSIVAFGGHDSAKCWVNFTVTVEDTGFDNPKVDCLVVLTQDAFPRRHNVPAGSSKARLGLICEKVTKFRVFDGVTGTPPSITDVTPIEGAVLSGDVEVKFTATDVDAASSKITSKVEVKKAGSSTWNLITKTDNKFIWKTASMSGTSYIFPDGDYQIRITSTDYWDEVGYRMINVSVLNPDAPVLVLDETDLKAQIGSDNKIDGTIDIKWSATDDEDDASALTASVFYKRASDTWTAIVQDIPNTNNYLWDTQNPRVADGNKYRILVKVKDTAGTEVEAGMTVDFTINNPDAPSLSIVSPNSPGLEISKSLIVKWNAEDDEDQAQNLLIDLYMSNDGGETYEPLESGVSNTGSKQVDTTKFDDGTNYRIRVVVKDSTGLLTAAETAVFAIYNNDVPKGGFLTPEQDDKVGGIVDITWSAEDEEEAQNDLKVDLFYMSSTGDYWVDIIREQPNTGSYSWDTTEIEDGDGVYTLKLTVKDSRDLSFTDTVYFEVYNPDAPIIRSTQAPSKDISGSGVFSFMTEDPDPAETELLTYDVYYSADGTQWILISADKPVTPEALTSYTWDVSGIPDGTYSLKIEVADPTEADLVTSYVFTGVVVNNPDEPTVAFTTVPVNGANVTGIVSLAWSGDDIDDDGMTYSVYYRKFGTMDWTSITIDVTYTSLDWNTSKLAAGPNQYEIMVVAKDDSSAHLTGSSTAGPFTIYVAPTKKPIDDGGKDGDGTTEPASDNTVIIVGIAALVILLVIVLALVALVLVKRKRDAEAAAAIIPLGGVPGALPQPGQQTLPPQPQGALPQPNQNQLPPAPAQAVDPTVKTGAIQAPIQVPPKAV